MATGTQDIIRRSYVQVVKSTGMAKLTFSSKKTRWMVLYKDSLSGPSRLEVFQSEDDMSTPLTVIALSTVTSVEAVEGKKEFVVTSSGSQDTFACTAKADVDDWVTDINRCRGFEQDVHTTNGTALYDAIPGDEVFAVRLRRSTTLTFQGSCILEIEKNFEKNEYHVSLFTDQNPRRLIVKWQIDHIRQYGSNETAFKFQSGSKSSTGVDWFVMDTDPGVATRIHRAVDYWAKHIVEEIKNRSLQGSKKKLPVGPISSSSGSSISSGSGGGGGGGGRATSDQTYAQLNESTKKQASVYDSVVSEGNRLSMHQNPANHSQGLYQPLQPQASPPPVQETQYVTLNPGTRETVAAPVIPPRIPAPSKNGSQSQYMELKQDTREQVEPSYMGLGGK